MVAKRAAAKKLADGATVAVLTAAIQAKFEAMRKDMNRSMIEREDEIDMVLTGLVAGENCLVVGPPGTGKTFLAEAIARWLNGRQFYILMNKFTQPEELFGPLDVVALTNSRYRRITALRLPEVDIAILDEIWKASSAILNTTLRCLNEGVFENDGTLIKIPLLFTMAASNEWPGDSDAGKELGALLDRFLLRKTVKPIASPAGRKRLLWTPDHNPHLTTNITRDEILQARVEARSIPWQQGAMDVMERILAELKKEGITPGDRRQYKAISTARAYAYLLGASEVEPDHLEVLKYVLWNDPVEQPEKAAQIVSKLSNPQGAQITAMLLEAQTLIENTNLNDLKDCFTNSKKLQEIQGKLTSMKATDKQKTALDFVEQAINDIKVSAMKKSGFGD